jgi:hypothetical protein
MMGRTMAIASTVRDHAVHANDAFHRMDLTKSSIICHTHLPSTVVDSVTYCLLACTACHAGGTACESERPYNVRPIVPRRTSDCGIASHIGRGLG